MNIIKGEYCQLQNDCNNDDLYAMFKEHTGIELEFEIDQEYGTGCYGMCHFNENYDSLEKLEEKFQKFREKKLGKYDSIYLDDIVNYFRRKGILPEMNFLFSVDY